MILVVLAMGRVWSWFFPYRILPVSPSMSTAARALSSKGAGASSPGAWTASVWIGHSQSARARSAVNVRMYAFLILIYPSAASLSGRILRCSFCNYMPPPGLSLQKQRSVVKSLLWKIHLLTGSPGMKPA